MICFKGWPDIRRQRNKRQRRRYRNCSERVQTRFARHNRRFWLVVHSARLLNLPLHLVSRQTTSDCHLFHDPVPRFIGINREKRTEWTNDRNGWGVTREKGKIQIKKKHRDGAEINWAALATLSRTLLDRKYDRKLFHSFPFLHLYELQQRWVSFSFFLKVFNFVCPIAHLFSGFGTTLRRERERGKTGERKWEKKQHDGSLFRTHFQNVSSFFFKGKKRK